MSEERAQQHTQEPAEGSDKDVEAAVLRNPPKVRKIVYKAVQQALNEHHELRNATAKEVTYQLVPRGYLHEEPSVELVADALRTVEAEEQAFTPGIRPADL